MPDFGIFRGFGSKLFSDKLYAGQLPTQLGLIGSERFGFLLDVYPNAAAAYSLRKLRTAYTGSAIRVRRASDNAEQDIAFTALGELDTSSLTSFCSGTNGFVKTWYDQSGNANNATQTTAANQPQIVSSGSVINKNNKPTLDFDGTNDNLIFAGNFMGGSAGSGFSVSSYDNSTRTAREIIYGLQDATGSRFDFLIARQASNTTIVGANANGMDFYIEGDFEDFKSGTITDTNQHIFSAIYSNAIRRILYNNGTALSTYTKISLGNLDDGTDFLIGSDINSLSYIDGKIQEIVIWNSDQNSNLSAINNNINNFYSIY